MRFILCSVYLRLSHRFDIQSFVGLQFPHSGRGVADKSFAVEKRRGWIARLGALSLLLSLFLSQHIHTQTLRGSQLRWPLQKMRGATTSVGVGHYQRPAATNFG